MIRSILFDMDGVLIDSESTIRSCCIDAFKTLGITCTHADFMEFTGMSERGFFGGVLNKYGVAFTDDISDLCYDFYEKYSPKYSKADPKVSEMVKRLKANGYKTAVASSAIIRKVDINLKCLSLTHDDFDAVVSGDGIKHKKPDPEIFIKAAEKIGAESNSCAVIEDSVNGIVAGKKAGMKCIGILGTFSEKELYDAGADIVTDNVLNIEKLIENL